MANNCWNRVLITGDSDTLKKLNDKFESHTSLNYSNYAEMFDTDVSDMEGDDWGPKWFTPTPTLEDGQLIVTGDSAWSPAIEFFELISSEYSVKVDLSYDERGLDFAGRIVMDNGVVESTEEWTYWESLYLNDKSQFTDEIIECAGWCDSFEEVLETIALDMWKVVDVTEVNFSEYEELFEKYKDENS